MRAGILAPRTLVRAPAARGRSWARRLLAHRSFVFAGTILAVLAVVVVTGPAIAPADPLEIAPASRLLPPGRDHLMGTDHLGRDILSRVLYGARYSLAVGASAILLGASLGWLVGVLSGYTRGPVGIALTGLIDTFLAFPMELIALASVGITGTGLPNLVMAIALSVWPRIARVVRGEVLRLRGLDYVEAAQVLGATGGRVIWRHVTPNLFAPLVVALTFYVGWAILVEAALSFLGLGVPPPTPTWGNIASSARQHMVTSPWAMLFSGAAVGLTVLSLNLAGDALRDVLDPRLRLG